MSSIYQSWKEIQETIKSSIFYIGLSLLLGNIFYYIALGINNFVNSDDSNNKKYFNSLVILNHKVEILSVYNKLNLVPFGEFLPFEKTLSKIGLKKITPGYSSFSSGDVRKIINL